MIKSKTARVVSVFDLLIPRTQCWVFGILVAATLAEGLVAAAAPQEGKVVPPAPGPLPVAPLAQVAFADPALKKKVHCFTAAAEKLAGKDWYRNPFAKSLNPAARGAYFAEWSKFLDQTGEGQVNYGGPKEVHWVQLVTYFDPDEAADRETISGVAVHARWKSPGAGWSATVYYQTFHGRLSPRGKEHREDFHLAFGQYSAKGPAGLHLEVRRDGGASYFAAQTTNGAQGQPPTTYLFSVQTYDFKARSKVTPDKDVHRILASPESLRDFAVKAYEKLAEKIEADFASGKAVERAWQEPSGPQGPQPRRQPSDRKLTDTEKQQALEVARRSVQARIAALKEHYRQMHAAALKAFPLADCLR